MLYKAFLFLFQVDGLATLILCSGVVVAAGNEPFRLGNYNFHRTGPMTQAVYMETVEPSMLQANTSKCQHYCENIPFLKSIIAKLVVANVKNTKMKQKFGRRPKIFLVQSSFVCTKAFKHSPSGLIADVLKGGIDNS